MTQEAAHDASIPANLWRKSSFSSGESDCVEATPPVDGWVFVRDSKGRTIPPIAIPGVHWNMAIKVFCQLPERAVRRRLPFA